MKKCKKGIALVMAIMMMLTAFSIMPITSSAKSLKIRTTDPVLTNAYGGKAVKLNDKNALGSHIWNEKSKPAYISVTLKKSDKSKVIISYVVKLWKVGKTYKWQYGSWENHKFIESYTNAKGVKVITTKENNGIHDNKFCFQHILQKNCDVYGDKTKVSQKSNARKYLSIKFGSGTFNVDGLFRVYSNTTISGMLIPKKINNKVVKVKTTKLIKEKANPIFINFDNDDRKTEGYDGSGNIELRDFDVNCGSNDSHIHSSFMFFVHGSSLRVRNINVSNALYNTHAFQLTASKNITIDNCNFKNILYTTTKEAENVISTKDPSIPLNTVSFAKYPEKVSGDKYTGGYYKYELIQIEPDQPGSMPTIKTSWDGTPTKSVTISNCKFNGVVRAIGSHAAGVNPCHDIKIINNRFTNVVGNAIALPYKLNNNRNPKKKTYKSVDIKDKKGNVIGHKKIEILNISKMNITINKNKFNNVSFIDKKTNKGVTNNIKGSAVYYVKDKNIKIAMSGKYKNEFTNCYNKIKGVNAY